MGLSLDSILPRFVKRFVGRAGWPTTWAVAPRVLLGLKFLLVARLLGPEEFGHYALALVGLAVVEGLSEFGFKQAIIQGRKEPELDSLSEVVGLQSIRGVAIFLLFGVVAVLGTSRLGHETAISLAVVGAIPLLRGLGIVPQALLQRGLRYRDLAMLEFWWRGLELGLALVAALVFQSSLAVVVSTLLAEAAGLVLSWMRGGVAFRSSWPTARIASWTGYGRWIWGQSLLTVLLNQFDKFFVAGWFGAATLGGYQGVQRLLQLVLADPVLMATNALFPRMAKDSRDDDRAARENSVRILHLGASGLTLALAVLVYCRELLVQLVLGPGWDEASPYVPIFASTMALGAAIAFFVTWYRSSGQPSLVVWATAAQVAVYVPLVWFLGHAQGPIGVAMASNLALWVALGVLVAGFRVKTDLLGAIGFPGFVVAAGLALCSTIWPGPVAAGIGLMAVLAILSLWRLGAKTPWKAP